MTLPDPSHNAVERALPEEPGHGRLLDVPVAAETFERFGRVLRGPLARPELDDRGEKALDEPFVLVAVGGVVGPGQPHGGHGGRLRLEGEVGEHVGHERLVDEQTTERRAMGGMPGGLGQALADRPRWRPRMQSRRVWLTISMMVRTPLPSSPTSRPIDSGQFDLTRCVRTVAQLVLQPLDPDRVPRAVGAPARHPEAAESGGGLGQHEEPVGHRRRAEPLVAR